MRRIESGARPERGRLRDKSMHEPATLRAAGVRSTNGRPRICVEDGRPRDARPPLPAATVVMSTFLRVVLTAGGFAALALAPTALPAQATSSAAERAGFTSLSNVKSRYPQAQVP